MYVGNDTVREASKRQEEGGELYHKRNTSKGEKL